MMPSRLGLTIVCLALAAAGALFAAEVPVAVSPGSPEGGAIESGCPTFSWDAVRGSAAHELVVYRIGDRGREAMPVLRRRVPGSASSWTPTMDSCLERGGRYAWTVRAIGRKEASPWSSPSLFQVAAGPSAAEFEAALVVVRDYLAGRAAPEAGGIVEDRAPREAEAASERSASSSVGRAVAATQLTVEGGIEATSFTGDGSTLTDLDWGNLTNVPAGFADGTDDDSGGDITRVIAGAGLTGGAFSGVAQLDIDTSVVAMKNQASGNQIFDTDTLVLDYTNNRVGINNANPARRLDIAGSMQVSGDYYYTDSKTGYHWVSAADFQRSEVDAGWELWWSTAWEYRNDEVTSLFGPVDLPHGVEVTQVDCYYYDTSSTEDIGSMEIRWGRRPRLSPSIALTSIADVSGGWPGLDDNDGQANALSITGLATTINNQNNAYGLRVELQGLGNTCCANDPLFFGCRVTFDYSTAGP